MKETRAGLGQQPTSARRWIIYNRSPHPVQVQRAKPIGRSAFAQGALRCTKAIASAKLFLILRETTDHKVVQKQMANKPDPNTWIHEVSMMSHERRRAPTKHPGSRFLEDVVKGCGQIGVVAWPYGALCLQHLVATSHLQRTALTATNLSTCCNVGNGRQW